MIEVLFFEEFVDLYDSLEVRQSFDELTQHKPPFGCRYTVDVAIAKAGMSFHDGCLYFSVGYDPAIVNFSEWFISETKSYCDFSRETIMGSYNVWLSDCKGDCACCRVDMSKYNHSRLSGRFESDRFVQQLLDVVDEIVVAHPAGLIREDVDLSYLYIDAFNFNPFVNYPKYQHLMLDMWLSYHQWHRARIRPVLIQSSRKFLSPYGHYCRILLYGKKFSLFKMFPKEIWEKLFLYAFPNFWVHDGVLFDENVLVSKVRKLANFPKAPGFSEPII